MCLTGTKYSYKGERKIVECNAIIVRNLDNVESLKIKVYEANTDTYMGEEIINIDM